MFEVFGGFGFFLVMALHVVWHFSTRYPAGQVVELCLHRSQAGPRCFRKRAHGDCRGEGRTFSELWLCPSHGEFSIFPHLPGEGCQILCQLPAPLLSSSSPPPRPLRPPAQPRPSTHSVLCRTSTTTIHAQCSLPDLNHDHPRPVFPAGPQPRVSPPSVPCRTSTTTIHAQCSLPDLNREYPRQKICHIECQKICQIEC